MMIIDVRVADNDIITIKQSSGDGIINIPVDAKDLHLSHNLMVIKF